MKVLYFILYLGFVLGLVLADLHLWARVNDLEKKFNWLDEQIEIMKGNK